MLAKYVEIQARGTFVVFAFGERHRDVCVAWPLTVYVQLWFLSMAYCCTSAIFVVIIVLMQTNFCRVGS